MQHNLRGCSKKQKKMKIQQYVVSKHYGLNIQKGLIQDLGLAKPITSLYLDNLKLLNTNSLWDGLTAIITLKHQFPYCDMMRLLIVT